MLNSQFIVRSMRTITSFNTLYMGTILRIDGTLDDVDAAYDAIRQVEKDITVDTRSPLNVSTHPQSATALDVVTTQSIDEIRALLEDLDVSVEVPDDAELEAAIM